MGFFKLTYCQGIFQVSEFPFAGTTLAKIRSHPNLSITIALRRVVEQFYRWTELSRGSFAHRALIKQENPAIAGLC